MSYPAHGSCLCGNVTYTLLAAPLAVAACHCRQCQKQSGSAFGVSAMVARDAITFEGNMSEWTRVADSGGEVTTRFCPACGTHLCQVSSGLPDHVMLKPSTLDDRPALTPQIHVWTGEKQDWCELPEGVAAFVTQPRDTGH